MDQAPRRPAARVSAARDMLDGCDRFEPGSRDAIRALIPPEHLRVFDACSAISWLDVEHDHWIMDALVGHFGRDRARECVRQALVGMVHRPLFRSLVEPALRLFAGRPGSIAALLPRAWPLAYRDFCTPSFARLGPGSARLVLDGIAPQAFISEGYLVTWHGICLGALDIERLRDPAVRFQVDRPQARAVATFSWRE
ncbi:MAG: hypothetical protein QM767_16165 [Anaeromyxobacter sp.]